MKANEIMTRRVLTVRQNQFLVDAARLMLKRHVSGLPVVNAVGELVGMITEGDFLRRTETGTEKVRARWLQFVLGPARAAEEFTHTHGRRVSEVMSAPAYSTTEDASLDEVVRLMERHRIKRLPVLRNGKIVGIVSRANLMHALLDNAKYETTALAGDRQIRKTVLAEMENQAWAPKALVEVRVEDGVVTFTGTIVDERDRAALKVLAENVPGVRAVRDEMVWIEPLSGMVIPSSETESLAKANEAVS